MLNSTPNALVSGRRRVKSHLCMPSGYDTPPVHARMATAVGSNHRNAGRVRTWDMPSRHRATLSQLIGLSFAFSL
uniref:Uncharacterized protein n=1 Tax=Panagrellus redivivus TaxID=6233 RepID=A0A7E4V7N6_PANRE